MIIPDKFKLAGFEIKVEFVDKTDDNCYGCWDDVNNTISIAQNISLKNGERTPLSARQMANTFFHEVCHAMQFYSGKPYSETECNIFANFMLEIYETKQVKS